MFHELKKKLLRRKLESVKVQTERKKELLEIEREIDSVRKIEYSEEEERLKQESIDKHNDRADKLKKKIGSGFKVLGDLAGNVVDNVFEDEKPKKKRK